MRIGTLDNKLKVLLLDKASKDMKKTMYIEDLSSGDTAQVNRERITNIREIRNEKDLEVKI